MQICIFPRCKRLKDGSPSPKDYPYWQQLVSLMKQDGYDIIQISPFSEEYIDGVKIMTGALSIEEIKDLVNKSVTYISCDSFAPHLLSFIRGYVIFGVSDPKIYGYERNLNILKDRSFLKKLQFEDWRPHDNNKEAYLSAGTVWQMIKADLK